MPSTSLFRFLVVLNIVLSLASALSRLMLTDTLPDALRVYRQALQETAFSTESLAQSALLLIVALIQVASWVGLVQMKNWGRLLFLLAWALWLPISVLFGAIVIDGFTYALDSANYAVAGGILALAFLSPLRSRFGEAPQPKPEPKPTSKEDKGAGTTAPASKAASNAEPKSASEKRPDQSAPTQ